MVLAPVERDEPIVARAGADAGMQRGTGGSLEGVRWGGWSEGLSYYS